MAATGSAGGVPAVLGSRFPAAHVSFGQSLCGPSYSCRWWGGNSATMCQLLPFSQTAAALFGVVAAGRA
jgi:hypothetical protein